MLFTGFSSTAPEFVALVAGVVFFTYGAIWLLVMLLLILNLLRSVLRV